MRVAHHKRHLVLEHNRGHKDILHVTCVADHGTWSHSVEKVRECRVRGAVRNRDTEGCSSAAEQQTKCVVAKTYMFLHNDNLTSSALLRREQDAKPVYYRDMPIGKPTYSYKEPYVT